MNVIISLTWLFISVVRLNVQCNLFKCATVQVNKYGVCYDIYYIHHTSSPSPL